MKIGMIIPQSKFLGGGPRLALTLAQELKKMEHDVTVYTFSYSPADTYYTDLVKDLPIVSLPSYFNFKPKPLLGINVPGLSSISQFVHEQRMCRALALEIDPTVEALNPHGRLGALVAYYFKKRAPGTPIIWQMNDIPLLRFVQCDQNQDNPDARCSWIKKAYYHILDIYGTKMHLPSIDEISVLDYKNKDRAKKYLGRDATVIRSGVDVNHFTYKKRQGVTGKRFTLMSNAQFFKHRRYEDVIAALKILVERGYDPYYVMSGDHETYRSYRTYRDYLLSFAKKHGVEKRISFPGRVSEEKLLSLFHETDIFVFPHHMQTWGLVVFEAMATGLPTIVSRGAGAHEVLTDMENSILVDERNPKEIATAVEKLVSDKILYEKISAAGSTFARESLPWRNYATGVLALIKKVMEEKPNRTTSNDF